MDGSWPSSILGRACVGSSGRPGIMIMIMIIMIIMIIIIMKIMIAIMMI